MKHDMLKQWHLMSVYLLFVHKRT